MCGITMYKWDMGYTVTAFRKIAYIYTQYGLLNVRVTIHSIGDRRER